MTLCPRCQKIARVGAKFCFRCGFPLIATSVTVAAPAKESDSDEFLLLATENPTEEERIAQEAQTAAWAARWQAQRRDRRRMALGIVIGIAILLARAIWLRIGR